MNTAPYEELLRVPGIGVRGAKAIVGARRATALGEAELRKLGVAYKQARFFITCRGRYQGHGTRFDKESLHAQLAAPIQAGSHGLGASAHIFSYYRAQVKMPQCAHALGLS